jgi:hypothetical protein
LGVAVKVTVSFVGSVSLHVDGPLQSTLPPFTVPLPEISTVNSEVAALASAQVAFTVRSLFISTVQETPVPPQSPDQPLKTLLASGVSTTVRIEPLGTLHEQSLVTDPHSISLLPPVTVPEPVKLTESVRVPADGPANIAVIWWASLSETVQGLPPPSHEPGAPVVKSQSLQATKSQASAVLSAVSTAPLLVNVREHALLPSPHLIPPGSLVTRPLPITLTATRPAGGAPGGGGGAKVNVACTL